MTSDGSGLAALERLLEQDFERLNHPPKPWVYERVGANGRAMPDVVIVGGGMCGLAAAFALRRLGIAHIRHIDRSEAGQEGPWLTYARMTTLRSPKHLTGPAQGIANLTFRAWYEAQHGAKAWDGLDRIPRPMWMDYLRWYGRVTGASVENGISVIAIRPGETEVALDLRRADGVNETISACQVVLATGREGQSRPRIPASLVPFFGTRVWHSSDRINFDGLAGKRIAVIGLAASAFDNAAAALEAGAAAVVLIARAKAMPRLNKMKQTVYPGFTHGFPALSDAEKLRFLRHIMESRIAPPRASVLRVSSDPRLRLMLGAQIVAAEAMDDGLSLRTTGGTVDVDAAILGTGFAINLDTPPELAGFAKDILRWRDRLPNEAEDEWLAAPYLGEGFEFRAKGTHAPPGLARIRCFTHTAQLSLGNLANDIPAVSEGAQRLAESVASALFVEDRSAHWDDLVAFDDAELLGDEWPGLAHWSPPLDT